MLGNCDIAVYVLTVLMSCNVNTFLYSIKFEKWLSVACARGHRGLHSSFSLNFNWGEKSWKHIAALLVKNVIFCFAGKFPVFLMQNDMSQMTLLITHLRNLKYIYIFVCIYCLYIHKYIYRIELSCHFWNLSYARVEVSWQDRNKCLFL